MRFFEKYRLVLLMIVVILGYGGILLYFDGTGDSGDSILHYLFAKSAPLHPELYLNHWAKPVFTLLASPFAQFGFIGMKVFNMLVVMATCVFTYKSAERWNLKRAYLTVLVIICSPLLIRHTFSGLTEPLFALFIALGMYLVSRQRYIFACVIVSFLPFVRSEGLIVMTAFGLFLLLRKEWKALPWLLFGHVIYSLVGWFHYKDILWVFTKIPYATASSNYGHGSLFHFADQLPFVIGIPSVILLVLGIVALLLRLVRKKCSPELHGLVLYGFISFFVAHSLFWYLGIFNSMGLNRVLLGVTPFIAIICLVGANMLIDWSEKPYLKNGLGYAISILVLSFPFLKNPSSVHWHRDMNLSKEQQVAEKAAQFALELPKSKGRYIYLPPYLSVALDVDHFDYGERGDLNQFALEAVKTGDVFIWDNWFSPVDGHVTQQEIEATGKFEKLKSFTDVQGDREIVYIVYQAK